MKNLLLILFIFLSVTVFGQIKDTISTGDIVMYDFGNTTYEHTATRNFVINSRTGVVKGDRILRAATTATANDVATLLASMNANDILAFERGGTYRVAMDVPVDNVSFCAYGTGALPIIEGADVITGFTSSGGGNDTTRVPLITKTEWSNASWWTTLDGAVATVYADSIVVNAAAYSAWATRDNFFVNGKVYEQYIKVREHTGSTSDMYMLYDATGGGWQVNATGEYYRIYNDGDSIYDGTTIRSTAYAGAQFTIDSMYVNEITITPTTSNVWTKSGITTQPYIMFLNGTKGTLEASIGAVDAEGDWFWDSGTNILHVYSTTDPSGLVELGQRGILFDLSSRFNVTLKNLTIQHGNNDPNAGARKSAVYLINGGNITISGCTIRDNSTHGVQLMNSSNITVDYCTFQRNAQKNASIYALNQSMSNITFSNNYSGYAGQDGVMIYVTQYGNWAYNVEMSNNHLEFNKAAGGYVIRGDTVAMFNNIVNDNGDAALTGEDYGLALQGGKNADVYNNTITNTLANDGLQVWATTQEEAHNLRIFRNFISGTADGDCLELIAYNDQSMLNPQVFYNVFANATFSGLVLSNNGVGTTDTVHVYNNTFYNNDQDIYKGSLSFPVEIKNNIFSYTLRTCVRAYAATNVYSDNNLWYKASGNVLEAGGSTYTTATITNYESTAQTGIPQFTDAANGDFILQAGSPAINNGVDLGFTTDILGNSIVGLPDIGAYERQ